MNKHLTETVTHGALSFKLQGANSGLPDSILESAFDSSSSEVKAKFKNVCAPIPLSTDEELETMLSLLGLSKRTFIQMAIYSAMEEAQAIMDDIDVAEYFVESQELK